MTFYYPRFTPLLLAIATAAASATAWLPPAAAQDKYPARTVEIVVPFAAGGGTDVLARLFADGLARQLGQSFVVINRPGANTNLGTQLVAKAKPDGYTLVMASLGIAANPSLYRKLGYDPATDLVPISLLANAPTMLVVHPSFPANTLAEFIAYVKANPGKLNYASYGAGSGPHLATELFKSMTGADIVHVPFNGGGPAAIAVTGNQVQMLFASVLPVPVAGAQAAISSRSRSPPTSGRRSCRMCRPSRKAASITRPGPGSACWRRRRRLQAIVDLLHANTIDVLKDQTLRAKMSDQGADVVGNTPAQFRAHIERETARLAKVIKNAKIQLD